MTTRRSPSISAEGAARARGRHGGSAATGVDAAAREHWESYRFVMSRAFWMRGHGPPALRCQSTFRRIFGTIEGGVDAAAREHWKSHLFVSRRIPEESGSMVLRYLKVGFDAKQWCYCGWVRRVCGTGPTRPGSVPGRSKRCPRRRDGLDQRCNLLLLRLRRGADRLGNGDGGRVPSFARRLPDAARGAPGKVFDG